MASLTVRNIPEDAKLRFRQIAAAHGRSMEEHLRLMVLSAGLADAPAEHKGVSDVTQSFKHFEPNAPTASRPPNWIDELIRIGQGLDIEIPPRKPEKLRPIDL
jgi:plasmid stability protein